MIQWIKNIFKKEEIEADPMKYLIVGLGNIGEEYRNTRHNVGFEVLDKMVEEADKEWKVETLGSLAEVKHKGRTLLLLKPSTYMNRSGKAVRYWLQKHKIEKSNLLVVVDDLNLPFGKQRLRGKGSAGGHNGLKDIDAMNGGNNYVRLRVGIGSDFSKGKQIDFVLGKWTDEETSKLPEIIDYAIGTIKSFAAIGLNYTMSNRNKK